MKEQTLQVPEVHCEHCVSSIEGAVGELSGVNEVKVDLTGKNVKVVFDESAVELQKIVDAIESQGYDVGDDGDLIQLEQRPD